jgi:uncharacterized damage-inducible protein DinB
MHLKDLERMYDYGYWANKRLLAVVAQLIPGQFTQSVAGSYGSVCNTLVHTLSAELNSDLATAQSSTPRSEI